MKLVIIGNQARAMSNFWTVLITHALAKGHEVVAFLPDSEEWGEKLKELGVRIRQYPLDRKGINPINDFATLVKLRALLIEEKPDCLFAYTIKSLIYGSLAAALAKYPAKQNRHVMITGLGYAFEADKPLKKILRFIASSLYRLALMQVNTVFFQNKDDKALFEKFKIIPAQTKIEMCRGTGVNLDFFALSEQPEQGQHFILIGRLLEAKGLREYYQAAKIVKNKYPETTFSLLGPAEQGVGAVPLSEVKQWQAEGIVDYLGEATDVRPYLEKANVVVLPSFREGTPCSLMEGMSMGRATLATDVPGCRETVINELNGFLTPLGDVPALSKAMLRFVENKGLAQQLGKAGRKLAEDEFDANKVAKGLLDIFKL